MGCKLQLLRFLGVARFSASVWPQNHAGWFIVEIAVCIYPSLPDRHLLLDFNFVESSFSDNVNLDAGTFADGATVGQSLPKGSLRFVGARIERSGIFDSAAVGTGGVFTQGPPGGSIVPSVEFTASEWIGSE
eukprot:COSAG04_NODE_960_length_9157_cov_6.389269_8_plen_132_part_00